MRIKELTIRNFRSYQKATTISFDNLTTFVGPNDIGKSSILEVLDIFFNDGKGSVKLDKDDINKFNAKNGDNDIVITISFSDLPPTILIDDTNETTLKNEYLLHYDGYLHVKKVFKGASTTASNIKVSIIAYHPSNKECCNLLQKKQTDLQKQVENLEIDCDDKRKNALMRSAIWKYYEDSLELKESEIEVASKDGDIKSIWEKLQLSLPCYSLFQADRKNSDSDSEVQDPLKEAVKHILSDSALQEKLQSVTKRVQEELQQVSDLTLKKIMEMDPEIAKSLHPKIDVANLKWADVFKNVSISGDNDIPINKRGSGVKRLVLINFFRAEAERKQKENKKSSIIYAIEEPETSQHKSYQRKLVLALLELSKHDKTQIVLSTHSADVVKCLQFENIRLVYDNENGEKQIKMVEKQVLPTPSLNEVNYFAFSDYSEEFHNELYGYLQSMAIDEDGKNYGEKEFDLWLVKNGCKCDRTWIKIKRNEEKESYKTTLQTYIRNKIHHPENPLNNKYSNDELKLSIEKMVELARRV